MDSLSFGRNDFEVEKIDIVSWDSRVAAENNIRSIPHFRIYDESGALVADGSQDGYRWFAANHPELLPR